MTAAETVTMSVPRRVVLSGDRPTGPLHLGHYAGSLKARVELQHHTDQLPMIEQTNALVRSINASICGLHVSVSGLDTRTKPSR